MQFTPTGGCQYEVTPGDSVLWAFNAFNMAHFLQLSGPTTTPIVVVAGSAAAFTVIDGTTKAPVAGATIAGVVSGVQYGGPSGADGVVQVTFPTPGVYDVKAYLDGSLRSNQLVVDAT
jgi:hypothetical protein